MIETDPVILAIVLVWLIFFGACIGSFLNVVVYRLPLGKSLSDPPSHCPKCGRLIRWHDNVPMIGWVRLAGKCRDCREPISFRYPFVEGVCAHVFGLIAVALLLRGGDASVMEFVFLDLATSGFVVTLMAAGLIDRDGHRIPKRLFLPAVVLGLTVPWLLQESYHIRAFGWGTPVHPVEMYWIAGCVAASLVTGMLSVVLIDRRQRIAWLTASALCGLFLGWTGAIVVGTAALVCLLFRKNTQMTPGLILAATVSIGFVLLCVFFLNFRQNRIADSCRTTRIIRPGRKRLVLLHRIPDSIKSDTREVKRRSGIDRTM